MSLRNGCIKFIFSYSSDIEKHRLNLVIYGNDDHTHAVEALRQKFDDWKAKKEN